MIEFRAVEEADLSTLQTWRNSEDVSPYVREYRYLSMFDQKIWFENYQKQRRRSDWDSELMMILYRDDKHENVYPRIGCGGFVRMEWRNRKSEFSFYLGNKDFKNEDIIWESISNLLGIGFNVFNLNKVYWPVYGHDPNLKTYKEIFKEEAILKEEYFWMGKFQDRHYLSLTKKEFDNLLK